MLDPPMVGSNDATGHDVWYANVPLVTKTWMLITMMMTMMLCTEEADLNAVVRAVGLLDVSVSKSKPHVSSRRRPATSVCHSVSLCLALYFSVCSC